MPQRPLQRDHHPQLWIKFLQLVTTLEEAIQQINAKLLEMGKYIETEGGDIKGFLMSSNGFRSVAMLLAGLLLATFVITQSVFEFKLRNHGLMTSTELMGYYFRMEIDASGNLNSKKIELSLSDSSCQNQYFIYQLY